MYKCDSLDFELCTPRLFVAPSGMLFLYSLKILICVVLVSYAIYTCYVGMNCKYNNIAQLVELQPRTLKVVGSSLT